MRLRAGKVQVGVCQGAAYAVFAFLDAVSGKPTSVRLRHAVWAKCNFNGN